MKVDREKIMLLLAKKHMTQKDLAVAADMSRGNLSVIINGKTCRPSTIIRIADALVVDIDEILEK